MIKTTALWFITGITLLAAALFAQIGMVSPAYPQETCTRYVDVMKEADPDIAFVNLTGEQLAIFAAEHQRQTGVALPPTSRITIFLVDPSIWVIAAYDTRGCLSGDPFPILADAAQGMLLGPRAGNE